MLMIPPIANLISSNAILIERELKDHVQKTHQKYHVFLNDQDTSSLSQKITLE